MELSDHDLLLIVNERVKRLNESMTNHLAHHWCVTLAAIGALLTASLSLAVLVVKGLL